MEKINLVEILKDCPKGMELDCTTCNNVVTLVGVDKEGLFPIRVVSKSGFHHLLTCEGCVYADEDAKCVIFPKGKTTWEGFVPLYKFKEGDVIFKRNFIAIIHLIEEEGKIWYHCWFNTKYENYKLKKDYGIGNINDGDEVRLATEEEKKKLFDAIKENGYRWDEETKKLEKVSQYPQTFEECCTVLGLTELGIIGGYRHGLLTQFRNLLICRDAYWKIAGDWKFDFDNEAYYLCNEYHEIQKFRGVCDCNAALAFPTAEMRDAFYENFKELMNECKSLL